MKFNYPAGATPLDANEISDLIPKYITTQSELNALEQRNIVAARNWLHQQRGIRFFEEGFLRELHRQMFKDVWRWAGKYRTTAKTIGIEAAQIPVQVHQLLKNLEAWIEYKSYPWDEIAARFHHRLVAIHPFANGNGRHARLMTDVLLEIYGQPAPTWGAGPRGGGDLAIDVEGAVRGDYIQALKAADRGNFAPLTEFLRR